MPTIDLAAALAAPTPDEVQQLNFAELTAAYFAVNLGADTAAELRLRKWTAAIGTVDAWALQTQTLEQAAEAMLAAGYAPASINRDLGAIGTLYRWAKRRRITPRGFVSPTISIRRYAEGIRRVEVSDEELDRLRDGALATRSRGFGAFVSCLIDSGARKGELLDRRWHNFDPEAGTLVAMKTKTGVPRTLFLRPATAGLLRRLGGANPPPDSLIFRGRYPEQAKDFRKAWATLTASIGRPDLHMQDVRHACAARLLRSGVTAAVAAQVLGHSPQILTQRYGHLETAHLRQAIERSWEAA